MVTAAGGKGVPSAEFGVKNRTTSAGSRRDLSNVVSIRKRGTGATTRVYGVPGTTPRAFDASLFLELNGEGYA